MKPLSKATQILAPDDFPLITQSQLTPNQTLPSFHPHLTSKPQSNQTHSQLTSHQPLNQGLKLKFNLNSDSLRCFMPKPKTELFRSLSLKLTKQSRSEASLQTFKLHLNQANSGLNDQFKSQTERHHVEQNQFSQIKDDGDLSTILSNQIISEIEKKGIRYNWSDNDNLKQETTTHEDTEDQEEIQELFNTFSEVKYKRKSVQEYFSANQSLVTEASMIEGEDTVAQTDVNFNNFSGYENIGYNQFYEQMPEGDQSMDKNYSMASTSADHYNNSIYYPMHMYQMGEVQGYGLKSMPSNLFPSGEFIIRPEGLGKDPRTTLMIKNIPNKYTIQYLSEEIDREFRDFYDFLYLPCDTKSGANQGYGFINFVDLDAISRFYDRFHGKKWGRFKSQKICNLTYARLQGIGSLIEHFQYSKVLNHKQKKYQPIIHINQQINNLIKEQQIAHESKQLERP